MEDLSGMSIAGISWRNGEINFRHAKILGKIFSEFHRQTHRDNVSEDMWKKLCVNLRLVKTLFLWQSSLESICR